MASPAFHSYSLNIIYSTELATFLRAPRLTRIRFLASKSPLLTSSTVRKELLSLSACAKEDS
jgi:hypothetical protein